MHDLLGNLVARTVSASQVVDGVVGSVVLSSVSGGVACTRVRGRLAVKTVSGAISVANSSLLSLNAKSVSGDFELSLMPGLDITYDLETISGNARIVVPAGSRLTVQMDTMGGTLRSELPETPIEVTKGHWHCDVGGGGGDRLRMRGVSGWLRLQRPEPVREEAADLRQVSPHPLARPMPPAADNEQVDRETVMMLILRAVEEGRLTVEQAAEKLQQLELAAAEEAASGQSSPDEASGRPPEERRSDGQ